MSVHPTTVIFSIDNPSHAQVEKFRQYCEDENILDRMKPLIGCYKGEEEPSFICSQQVFRDNINHSGFVDDQDSFLVITGCNKAYATLYYQHANRKYEALGSMCNVSEEVARSHDAWTYRPDIDAWYVCAHINPDHSHEIPVQV